MRSLPYKPILICGPTASGKSALGLMLAERLNGVIVNADALQVYSNWRILTARPSEADEARAPHLLYGHIAPQVNYSVGEWLREVSVIIETETRPLIILGGTGLYFTSLVSGLADIPEIPSDVRARGNQLRETGGPAAFLDKIDAETLAKTDKNNAMRLQRAWEVLEATGKGLATWQKETPAPMIALEDSIPIVLNSNTDWLNARIAKRFDKMLNEGAVQECVAVLNSGWNPSLPSSRALGASEIIAYLQGEMSLDQAREAATIATRQFAKRQRTWFRSKMSDWHQVQLDTIDVSQLADNIIQNGKPT